MASPAAGTDPSLPGIPNAVWEVIACPQCAGELARVDRSLRCKDCGCVFEHSSSGAVDLRLRRPKTFPMEFRLGAGLVKDGFEFGPLLPRRNPEVDFAGTTAPWHLTQALLSYFPKAASDRSIALDLGCGSGLHRETCERAGFQWAGLDYSNPMAPILGDGHALPFRASSVEFVVSMAVLEHIRYPFVVAQEVLRVLKPGGYYIGTVAFLEPFHGDSFYHHTHLGTYNTLDSAGFEVLRVAPNEDWSGLRAQANMSLFPRLPAFMTTALVWPLEALHRLWWRIGSTIRPGASERLRLLANAGSFEFVARKPEKAIR